jgi:hypothetical protein
MDWAADDADPEAADDTDDTDGMVYADKTAAMPMTMLAAAAIWNERATPISEMK